MSDAPNDGWLIHKQGRGWYRPKAQGYTMNPDEAGRYTYKDAMAYSHPNGIDGPRDGITIKHESELPPSPADLLEAERARADRLEAAHKENARILGLLVSELQGRVEASKLHALDGCLSRSRAALGDEVDT